jgi:hypothetical protein
LKACFRFCADRSATALRLTVSNTKINWTVIALQ